ncbi:MAG: glutathione S-transferase family protein [Oleibacter sp.]|nr:glutathione S-transferase family protein [Thalassolituus sp.]
MKLYDNSHAPNPRRVRMVLAEKGITDYEKINLDLGAGDNLHPDFLAKNPAGKIPVLELDDGLCLSETGAICRYLDETFSETSLYGATPKQRALIDMWDRRAEFNLVFNAALGFQHTSGFFKDRMTPFPEWGLQSITNYRNSLTLFEQQLQNNEWIAGPEFSIADITAVCAIDFSKVIKVRLDDSTPNLQRWYAAVRARDSYKA